MFPIPHNFRKSNDTINKCTAGCEENETIKHIYNCPEVGYCALPLFGLEADWGRGGVGIMIWGGQEGGYLEDGEGS